MILIFPIGLVLLFFGLWYYRRGSTLTRACRWRRHAPGEWHCAACGAKTALAPGQEPRHCLNPARQQ